MHNKIVNIKSWVGFIALCVFTGWMAMAQGPLPSPVPLSVPASVQTEVIPQASPAPMSVTETYLVEEHLITNMGVYTKKDYARGSIKGDILFLHGYGDQFINHQALFQKWVDADFRVISFDYPSHGKTTGKFWMDLSLVSLNQLAEIAGAVEKSAKKEKVPLFIAGWSLGGLIAARIAQTSWVKYFSRPISGMIFFAPAVAVYPCVGNQTCRITNSTLNHDDSLASRPISPDFPFTRPYFLGHMLWNIFWVKEKVLDANIPTLTILGGDKEDVYVKTKDAKKWVANQKKRGANIRLVTCQSARHELDNEPKANGGEEVRLLAVEFFKSVLNANPDGYMQSPVLMAQPLIACK